MPSWQQLPALDLLPPSCLLKRRSAGQRGHGNDCCQCLPDGLTQVRRCHRSFSTSENEDTGSQAVSSAVQTANEICIKPSRTRKMTALPQNAPTDIGNARFSRPFSCYSRQCFSAASGWSPTGQPHTEKVRCWIHMKGCSPTRCIHRKHTRQRKHPLIEYRVSNWWESTK